MDLEISYVTIPDTEKYVIAIFVGEQRFMRPFTYKDLMEEHESKPQNPIIANVLYKSKILESWGRGISTMICECKRVGFCIGNKGSRFGN